VDERPRGFRRHCAIGAPNGFHDTNRHGVGEARRTRGCWPGRGTQARQQRHDGGQLAFDASRAVPQDVAGYLTRGPDAREPAERSRAGVEHHCHVAEHLELGQLLACPPRQALRGAVRVGQKRGRRECGPDEATG
jgi:hypothetical protein